MLYLLILFTILSISKLSFKKIKSIDESSLSKETTTTINGFFVGLILFSHFNSYVTLNHNLDTVYLKIMIYIGQLMVTSFLFYSGYGIFESIKNKPNYMKTFFKRRFLKLFLSFSFIILLYIIVNALLGKFYSIKTIILSFIGIKSIGNSNWFIFATFCLYIIVMISFKLFKKNNQAALLLCILGSLIYIILLRIFKFEEHWYNTILCFNLGMYISYYKANILSFLKNKYNYYLLFIIISIIFVICHRHTYNYIVYELYSLIFVSIILLVSLKIKITNSILYFLGKNTFNIYVLQRMVYMILNKIPYFQSNIYIYFIVSIIIIVALSYILNYVINKLYRLFKLI